jgi:hypothetical protein
VECDLQVVAEFGKEPGIIFARMVAGEVSRCYIRDGLRVYADELSAISEAYGIKSQIVYLPPV